jgi:hypothetical protein
MYPKVFKVKEHIGKENVLCTENVYLGIWYGTIYQQCQSEKRTFNYEYNTDETNCNVNRKTYFLNLFPGNEGSEVFTPKAIACFVCLSP